MITGATSNALNAWWASGHGYLIIEELLWAVTEKCCLLPWCTMVILWPHTENEKVHRSIYISQRKSLCNHNANFLFTHLLFLLLLLLSLFSIYAFSPIPWFFWITDFIVSYHSKAIPISCFSDYMHSYFCCFLSKSLLLTCFFLLPLVLTEEYHLYCSGMLGVGRRRGGGGGRRWGERGEKCILILWLLQSFASTAHI